MNRRTADTAPSVLSEAQDRVARVLVVESRPMSSPMLSRWLERRGHTLDLATEAESGFQRVVTGPLFARHLLKPIDVDQLDAVLLEVAMRARTDADALVNR